MLGHVPQAERDDCAILALKRHDVGHGAQRGNVEIVGRAVQGAGKFEGDAGPAELGGRMGFGPALRVDYGQGGGQFPLDGMVVRDDEVDAERPRAVRGVVRRDTVVHGNDECDALLFGGVDPGGVEPIAVFDAMGHVMAVARDAEALQRAGHNRDGGNTIDVVVPENQDVFAVVSGAGNAVDGGAHVGHREGV